MECKGKKEKVHMADKHEEEEDDGDWRRRRRVCPNIAKRCLSTRRAAHAPVASSGRRWGKLNLKGIFFS